MERIKTLPSSASIVGDLNGIADKFQGLKVACSSVRIANIESITARHVELSALAGKLENHFHVIQKTIVEFRQATPTLEKLNAHPNDPYTQNDLDQFKQAHKKACESFWDRFFATDDVEQAAAHFENSLTDLVINLSNGDNVMLGLLSRELNDKTLTHLVAQAELAKTLGKLNSFNIKVTMPAPHRPTSGAIHAVSSGVSRGLAQSPFYGDLISGFITGFTNSLSPEWRSIVPQELVDWAKLRCAAWEARVGPAAAKMARNPTASHNYSAFKNYGQNSMKGNTRIRHSETEGYPGGIQAYIEAGIAASNRPFVFQSWQARKLAHN